jgi:hypothetical protein
MVDNSEIEEEQRSYVFPACGHVHGYHKSLDGRCCPLCRKHGPFVPIAFAFEPSLCDRSPTHVFNPCGHVASHRTCRYWSHLKLVCKAHHPQYNSPAQPAQPTFSSTNSRDWMAICPFCATHLDPVTPFSKLILQYETGTTWEEQENVATSTSSSQRSTSSSSSSTMADEGDEDTDQDWKVIRNYEWGSEEFCSALVTSQQMIFQRNRSRMLEQGNQHFMFRQSMQDLVFPCYAPQLNL